MPWVDLSVLWPDPSCLIMMYGGCLTIGWGLPLRQVMDHFLPSDIRLLIMACPLAVFGVFIQISLGKYGQGLALNKTRSLFSEGVGKYWFWRIFIFSLAFYCRQPCFNSLEPGRCGWAFPVKPPSGECNNKTSWFVNISLGNGLVLSGNKPLPEPMLTKFYDAIWWMGSGLTVLASVRKFLYIGISVCFSIVNYCGNMQMWWWRCGISSII